MPTALLVAPTPHHTTPHRTSHHSELRTPAARGAVRGWYASTLGCSTEDRLCGDSSRLPLTKWSAEEFGELVSARLKAYEREVKELHLLLFPEVCVGVRSRSCC
jgi:hypothetical protein